MLGIVVVSVFSLCVRSLVVVSLGPRSVFHLLFPAFVNSVFSRCLLKTCSIVFVLVLYLVGSFGDWLRLGIVFA